MPKVVQEKQGANENGVGSGGASVLNDLVRDAARQMRAVASATEVSAYVEAHFEEVEESGRRLLVRNGYRDEPGLLSQPGRGP